MEEELWPEDDECARCGSSGCRFFLLPCTHSIREKCVPALWAAGPKATCPSCAAEVKSVSLHQPERDLRGIVLVKFRGVKFEYDLQSDDASHLHRRLAAMLVLPRDRLKLVHMGKLLSSRDALRPGMVLQALGTAASEQLPAVSRLAVLRQALPALPLPTSGLGELSWSHVADALLALANMCWLFLRSLVMPPPRRR